MDQIVARHLRWQRHWVEVACAECKAKCFRDFVEREGELIEGWQRLKRTIEAGEADLWHRELMSLRGVPYDRQPIELPQPPATITHEVIDVDHVETDCEVMGRWDRRRVLRSGRYHLVRHRPY